MLCGGGVSEFLLPLPPPFPLPPDFGAPNERAVARPRGEREERRVATQASSTAPETERRRGEKCNMAFVRGGYGLGDEIVLVLIGWICFVLEIQL